MTRVKLVNRFGAGWLAAGLWMLSPAAAQVGSLSVPAAALKPRSLVTPVELTEPASIRAQPAVASANRGTPRWVNSAFDLDLPRDLGTGVYSRPKIIVGVPSAPMRNWLRSAGFEAERCMLPMLRARTKLSSGDLDGTLWLYARCTFH